MKSSLKTVPSRFASPLPTKHAGMGVRKIPAAVREKLRLIDIRDFDLNACGGTHVRSTGQIGAILLRKLEKVKQGTRVEFVCGLRAVSTARRDFQTLTDAAAAFSTQIWEVPQQVRKSLDEIKTAQKTQHRLLEEVAELQASNLLQKAAAQPKSSDYKLVVEFFADRDLAFIKMLAQKLIRLDKTVALLACGGAQPSLVFRANPRTTQRHGRAHERHTSEAWHTRRWHARHGPGWRSRCRPRRTCPHRSRHRDRIGAAACADRSIFWIPS